MCGDHTRTCPQNRIGFAAGLDALSSGHSTADAPHARRRLSRRPGRVRTVWPDQAVDGTGGGAVLLSSSAMSRYRLIGAPMVESTLLGTLAGATAQLLLPGASAGSLGNGVVPGFVLGLVGGVLLAGVTHHVDGQRSDLIGHAPPVSPWWPVRACSPSSPWRRRPRTHRSRGWGASSSALEWPQLLAASRTELCGLSGVRRRGRCSRSARAGRRGGRRGRWTTGRSRPGPPGRWSRPSTSPRTPGR